MSVLFLVVAVIYALISVVAVGINNVQETQNLVPNIIVTTPISSTLTANVSVYFTRLLHVLYHFVCCIRCPWLATLGTASPLLLPPLTT